MAMVKDTRKNFCDEAYTELSNIKERVVRMRDQLSLNYPAESDMFKLFDRHICELADQIDWKLQILSHACPYDWKGSSEIEYEENIAQVGPSDTREPDFAGGYLGG